MMPNATPAPGADLSCLDANPWKVFLKREPAAQWVAVASLPTRNAALQHMGLLQRLISTAQFDVAFEVTE